MVARMGKRHRPNPKREAHNWKHIVVGIVASTLLVTTTLGGVAAFAIQGLGNSITRIDTPEPTSSAKAKKPRHLDTSATNILIMGSDKRVGAGNTNYGYVEGARSDTTILVHLYAGRKSALAVSIPRDSYITIPPCKMANGETTMPYKSKFNAAYSIGGPTCTIKTVEYNTGIKVDNFVVLDFNAFKKVVDAIGGVQVCLTTPVYDPIIPGVGGSGLNLPAGFSTIDGEDALKFVRARESLGDGSDIGRIQRQQEFISSMVRGIKKEGIITNPFALFRILRAVTTSLSTSPDLSGVPQLEDFAASISGMSLNQIKFTTVPNEYIENGNVGWLASAKIMFAAIRKDKQWPPAPKPQTSPSGSPTGSPTGSPSQSASAKPTPSPSVTLVTPPKDVRVLVVNASGRTNLGTVAADSLRARGFNIDGITSVAKIIPKTKVRYRAEFSESARTAAYSARTDLLVVDPTLDRAVVVVVGKDWTNAREVPLSSGGGGVISAGDNVCSAGNNRTK